MHPADDQETTVEKICAADGVPTLLKEAEAGRILENAANFVGVRGAGRAEADSLLFDLNGREPGKPFES